GSECLSSAGWNCSADPEQVDDEDQRLAGLDHPAGAAVAVPQVRRDDELATATNLHALDPGVPALDDLTDTQPELQRLAAVVRRVELLAGRVRHADVVHLDGVAGRGLGPVSLSESADDALDGWGGAAD